MNDRPRMSMRVLQSELVELCAGLPPAQRRRVHVCGQHVQ